MLAADKLAEEVCETASKDAAKQGHFSGGASSSGQESGEFVFLSSSGIGREQVGPHSTTIKPEPLHLVNFFFQVAFIGGTSWDHMLVLGLVQPLYPEVQCIITQCNTV